jgi:predicted XRE-type DNA-binding protein
MSDVPKHTVGSGNVFADLGLPDADLLLAKAELARQIGSIIEHRHLTQAQAAQILGIDQPKVSSLLRGRLEGFSMERLTLFLVRLGRDVQIVVSNRRRAHARAGVTVVKSGGPRSSPAKGQKPPNTE